MKKIIVNTSFDFVMDKLYEYGFDIIPVIKSDRVSAPISAHADVLYNKVFDNEIMLSACQKANLPQIIESGYKCTVYDKLLPGYKTECGLNFVINNEVVLKNPKTAADIDAGDKKVITVKQGYTRCSVLEITDNVYITDDEGIYSKLTENLLNCLLVKKGIVQLDGYDYGFIGGATINMKNGKILFCGDIENTEEKYNIEKFLFEYSKEAVFIKGKTLTDIGSGIVL
ncbi:MAG: hypothetical protein PUB11_04305 [Oscillospiraceae bacterium]|nr:hypothetical protein [Oscillospiraceae bacterium]